MNICIQNFTTPYGELIIGDYNGELCLCDWRYRKMRQAIDDRLRDGLRSEFEEKQTGLISETEKQLTEYFRKERVNFEIPLLMVGTNFQKSVWVELLKIPYGKTETYLGLSEKLNNTKAIRAVAAANGANAISIIVPCHRVVGSSGELVGYAGGVEVKKKLLRLENSANYAEQLKLF
jgi:methylated-DNA-[protein]-cysteine S-methyltransferase